ncbi:MAG: hypothetical protein CFH34_00421 [Alphaproteobacteria bacterium MarineAlpha9_Bin4]|nr:TVP38/TMEM64 family protein [Pelagibacterales bacterium]PPR27144.1 MAG: hypothetical protein CFH34_00421 [Alphaproteobacteria bacterium MarineAlpha9_Bin4]
MNKFKILLLISVLITILLSTILLIYYDLFSLNYLRKTYLQAQLKVDQNYALYFFFFLLTYFLIAALSLPFSAGLSIFIGSLFTFFDAILIVCIGASLGALVSFLLARFTLKSLIEKRYKLQAEKINKGLKENGLFYLFFLRVTPIFPFFIINFMFGITNISAYKFYLISFIGMLPGIFLYVNAGSQISKIGSFNDIYSLKILCSIFLIGIFPLMIKKMIYYFKLIKK